MGITLGSNFDVQTALPLDSRIIVADTTARDALSALRRYEGLTVYSLADETNYQLVGGITNGDWVNLGAGAGTTGVAAEGFGTAALPYTMLAGDNGKVLQINTTGGAGNITLHAAIAGFKVTIIDIGGMLSTNAATLIPNGAQKIQGLAANYLLESNYGSWTLGFDGTDWFLIGAAKNKVVKTFTGVNQNWTAPAGVKQIRVSTFLTNQWLYAKAANGPSTTLAAHSLFLNRDGDCYACGSNVNGQLGTGDVASRSSPVLVVGGVAFKKVIAGQAFNLGLDSFGAAWAWGLNANGQLGDGTVVPKSSPVLVLGGLVFTDIAAGEASAMAITAAGALYSWGLNANGQLGHGDVTPKSSPVAVLGGLVFTQFAVGSGAAGGVAAGAGYAWGVNTNGNLGHGNVTAKSSPVAILGGLTLTKVVPALGGSTFSTYVLTDAGVGYAIGGNTTGQLGVGDVTPRSSPVAILGGFTFADFAPAGLACVGLATNGAAYGWGNGNRAGLNTTTAFSSPILIGGGVTWAQISSSATHAMGLNTLDVPYSFGTNADGQLAIGSVTGNSSPVVTLKPINLQIYGTQYNSAFFSTTPGTVYAIKSLGSAGIDTTVYKLASYLPIVTLEYYA